MRTNSFRVLLFLCAGILIFIVSGCSKNEDQAPAQASSAVKSPAELPVLSQNEMYKTNNPVSAQEPDYSFNPILGEVPKPPKDVPRKPAVD